MNIKKCYSDKFDGWPRELLYQTAIMAVTAVKGLMILYHLWNLKICMHSSF